MPIRPLLASAVLLWVTCAFAQNIPEASIENGFFASYGAHFTVLFEGPSDEALARRAVDLLDAAYYRIGAELYTFPDRTITVMLYTEQQFRDVTRSPEWAAAAYDGRIHVPMRGALARPEELERVLAHEFTHALVQSIAPRGVPTWLHEGLAVYFEQPAGAATNERRSASGDWIPLQKLAGSFAGLSPADARTAYAQSAAVVGRLLDQSGPAALVALLHDLARGESLPAAFERRMLIPYDTVVEPPR